MKDRPKNDDQDLDKGVFLFADGEYEGQYNINKHGTGKFMWTNGEKYNGQWYKNNMNGIGTYSMLNGNKY